MNPEDLVFYKENNSDIIQSGGYKVESILLQNNIPLMINALDTNKYNTDNNKLFDNLGVPTGLCFIQNQLPIFKKFECIDHEKSKEIDDCDDNGDSSDSDTSNVNDDNIISTSLYDELLKLVTVKKINNKTKKTKVINKKTKRNIKNKKSNLNKTNKITKKK